MANTVNFQQVIANFARWDYQSKLSKVYQLKQI